MRLDWRKNFTIGGAKWSRLTAIEGTASRYEDPKREGRRPKIEKRTKKIPRSPFIFEIIILLLYQPFKYKHKIPLFSPLPLPPSLSGSISFFSLLYTLFRFSLFCGLRRFALQLIISPFPISPLPYPFFHISRIVSSSSLFFSVSLSLLSLLSTRTFPVPVYPLALSFTIIIRGHIRPLCPGPDIQHNPL